MLRTSVLIFMLTVSPALADVFTFETPSGNIQCSVGLDRDRSDIECTIIDRRGPPAAPRPAGCEESWGHSFFMRDKGPVAILCERLDRTGGGYERAEYGVTGRFGGFTCHSSRKGFDCHNTDGHGFFLSRARQTVF